MMTSSYPNRLIPAVNSVKIQNIEPDKILCRWTVEELKAEDGSLNAAAVYADSNGRYKHLKNYSLNLIPPAEVVDAFIVISDVHSKGYESEWVENTSGLCPDDNEFYIDESRAYFLLRVGDFHNYTATFPYPQEPRIISAPEKWSSFQLIVEHIPLNSNFSHCQFRFKYFSNMGNEITSVGDSTFKKIIAADVRQRIIEKAKFLTTEF